MSAQVFRIVMAVLFVTNIFMFSGCESGSMGNPSAIIAYGTATYPDGSFVANRPFSAHVTISGIGQIECKPNNYYSFLESQPVDGAMDITLAFDDRGRFQYQANNGFATWSFTRHEDRCTPDNVSLSRINVVRIDAAIAVNTTICGEYCTSLATSNCTKFCASGANGPSCTETCTAENRNSCETQCQASQHVVATATAYGDSVEFPDGVDGGSTGQKDDLPWVKFDLRFTSLE